MSRKFLTFAAAAFSLAMASSAVLADPSVVFRYKSAYSGVTGPVTPEVPEEPKVPSACPDAKGIYSASMVLPVDGGCLYTDPAVRLMAFELPLPPEPEASLDPWCAAVWDDSDGVDHGVGDAPADAVTYSGDWVHAGQGEFATYVLCADGRPVDPEGPEEPENPEDPEEPPHEPTDLLDNADFNERCGNGRCSWNSDQYGGLAASPDATQADKQLGGSGYLGPWSSNRRDRTSQFVNLPSALASRPFQVEVRWLQSASVAGGRGAVGIEFYAGSTSLGLHMSPFTSVDIRHAWFERDYRAVAPVGTTRIRVVADNLDSNARFDNIALKVDGVDYSTINGQRGWPERPADLLLNAGAESGNAHWRAVVNNGTPPYSPLDAETAIDPFNRAGNSWYSARYQDWKHVYQQVWVGESEVSRQLDLRWYQSSSQPTVTSGLVFAQAYTRNGTKLGPRIGRGQHNRVPLFWTMQQARGTIPAGAAYVIVSIETGEMRQAVDTITMTVDGVPYSAITGTVPQAFDYCPHYVNTVDGDGEWTGWADSNNGFGLWDEPLETTYLGEAYKNYCVPPTGGVLLAEYAIQGMKAYGGFEYTAYDLDGNVLKRKETIVGGGANGWDEDPINVMEAFRIPPGTAYLQKRFVRRPNTMTSDFWLSHYASVGQYGLKASNIHFTLNGTLSSIPAAKLKTKLYNGSADHGTKWWAPVVGSKGFLSVYEQKIVLAESSRTMPPSSSASTSEVPCIDPCGPYVMNKAFRAVTGQVDAYQDVDVVSYGFTPGQTVTLSWSQSATGLGFANWLAAWNSPDNGAAMSIEAYDTDGNLVASSRSESLTNLFHWNRRSVSIQLPADTWKLRAVMHFDKVDRALIDEVRLVVGGTNLTADDQETIQWIPYPPLTGQLTVLGADGSNPGTWTNHTGQALSTRNANPAPYATGGSGYYYVAGGASSNVPFTFHQDVNVYAGGHAAGEPVTVSWLQASYEAQDKATVNVSFYNLQGDLLGATSAPLIAISPALVWTERSATMTLPAGAARMRATITMERVSGTAVDGYVDNIRIRIGEDDYTDYTGPMHPDRILGADAEGHLDRWMNTGSGPLMTATDYADAGNGAYFHSSGANATFHQIADVSGRGHTAGELVELSWIQASYEAKDRGAVNVEFYDGNGNLVGSTAMPVETVSPGQTWTTRSTTISLPAGARLMKAVISMQRGNGTNLDAYIDNIRIRIGGVDYTDYTGS